MSHPKDINAGIAEAIERNAQEVFSQLQSGTKYETALAAQMGKSTLGPASWVKVINRIEALRNPAPRARCGFMRPDSSATRPSEY